MKLQKILLPLALSFVISACSASSQNKVVEDHVWKEQVATMDKAKAVEGILKKSAEAQKKALDDQM